MNIHFSKMQGLGNDFMVINGIAQIININAVQIRTWANRHTGIGFDQLLLLQSSLDPSFNFLYRIFNADGSEVAQCGNGARCIAYFIHLKKISKQLTLSLQTQRGAIQTELLKNKQVRVNMGIPTITANIIDLGNPHTVLFVDDIDNTPVATVGAQLQYDKRFPEQVNVGFAQIIDKHNLRLRVFERGVGETHACGSGACAAVIAGYQRGLLRSAVNVYLPGGELHIDWQGENKPVFLTGPAAWVFDGIIEL